MQSLSHIKVLYSVISVILSENGDELASTFGLSGLRFEHRIVSRRRQGDHRVGDEDLNRPQCWNGRRWPYQSGGLHSRGF